VFWSWAEPEPRVHWDALVFHPVSVKYIYMNGLDARVLVGVFGVDVEEVGGQQYVVRVADVKLGLLKLYWLRWFLDLEEQRGVWSRTYTRAHAFTAIPASLAPSLFYILGKLGFRRRWFMMVNADPVHVPFGASEVEDVLRNIAYIHAVHQFITAKRLKRRFRLRWGEVAATTHAILMRSGYNADKNLIQRHLKPETIEKLPRVVLT